MPYAKTAEHIYRPWRNQPNFLENQRRGLVKHTILGWHLLRRWSAHFKWGRRLLRTFHSRHSHENEKRLSVRNGAMIYEQFVHS